MRITYYILTAFLSLFILIQQVNSQAIDEYRFNLLNENILSPNFYSRSNNSNRYSPNSSLASHIELSGISNNIYVQWVKHYGSNVLPSEDKAIAMALDKVGNIYITGYGTRTPFGYDYLTVKYDVAGNQLWVARYDGSVTGDDYACAIVVDTLGNAYVTGTSMGTESDYDYATVKYNSNGIQQWVARYNGPANSSDYAMALALDASRNVCVTGKSLGNNTDYDYATIKYNCRGEEQWVDRYNGTANACDSATAITADDLGNIYVTGSCIGSSTSSEFVTLKYSHDGKILWKATYNGLDSTKDDFATDIALDDSGNTYITGCSNRDYATIKYGSSGVEKWVARHEGQANEYPTSLKVDAFGNIYVTGSSETYNSRYCTIKYNSAGIQIWEATDQSGYASDLSVDASGNVYVTGFSTETNTDIDFKTVKYNAIGVLQWVKKYNGSKNGADYSRALAIDDLGFIYVAGFSEDSNNTNDCTLIKYNTNGFEQWVAIFDGPGNSRDWLTDIANDALGNVYVTGNSCYFYNWTGSSHGLDFTTINYSFDGIEQWVAKYHPGNANAIAVDSSGNVYLAGTSNDDYITVKYNSSGIKKWVATYNGTGNGSDGATAIAIDAVGNVYVTGYSTTASNNADYATIKYDSNGVKQWVATYNGPANGPDIATAIGIDTSRNIYVTGTSGDNYNIEREITTVKYDLNGVKQWANISNNPGFIMARVNDMKIDAAGNIYITGVIRSGSITIKYNTNGVVQWVDNCEGSAIALDMMGNIYLAGSIYSGGISYDYITIKYDSEGNKQWIVRYDGTGKKDDGATDIAVDMLGNIYVTGSSQGSDMKYDITTIGYNSDGIQQWIARCHCPHNQYAGGWGHSKIGVDAFGDVYVTGSSTGNGWSIYTTTKYSQNAPPTIVHTPPDLPQSGQEIEINANVTDDKGIENVTLNYRKGGEVNFTSITMTKTAALYSGTIPGSEITSRGLEYFIAAMDLGGLTNTFPATGDVISLQVNVPEPGAKTTKSQPNGSDQTAYRLVSFPLDLNSKNASAVLRDDLGSYDKTKWRLFEMRADQQYYEFDDIYDIKPGEGFWLIVKSSGKVLDTGAGKTILTNKKYPIALNPGWTIIGNPFNFAIPLDKLELRSCQILDIRSYQSKWNSVTDFIQPFEGYAVANNNATVDTLYIDPFLCPVSGRLEKDYASREATDFLWSIAIQAQCQEALDFDNIAAVAKEASIDWDDMDRPEPPVIGEYVSVSFPHLDWEKPLRLYSIDVRPEPLNGDVWQIEVKTNIADRVNLTFNGLDNIPMKHEVWLVDEIAEISQNLRENNCYSVFVSNENHPKQLKLVVGSKDFIQKQVSNLPLVPENYELSQNYPNPFNPETQIKYALPTVAKVKIVVYNLMGQKIRTLINDHLNAGYHDVAWEGKNDFGNQVTSGVYLVRMEADKFIAVRKMILVR